GQPDDAQPKPNAKLKEIDFAKVREIPAGRKFRSRSVPLAANPVAHVVAPPRRLLEVMVFGRAHLESALVLNYLPGRSCLGVGVFDLQRDDCPMAYVYLRHFKI